MIDSPAPRRSPFADIAPALADYTDNVLFGDVWKRAELSSPGKIHEAERAPGGKDHGEESVSDGAR